MIKDTAPWLDVLNTKFGDPASHSIKDMLWTFSLKKNWKQNGRHQKVGHSDLDMIHGTAPCHDVLQHQVW